MLVEEDLLEKAATIKRFEYSPLGSELKKQTNIVKKNIKRISKIRQGVWIDEAINKNDRKPTRKTSKSNLIYDANYNFYKYVVLKEMII